MKIFLEACRKCLRYFAYGLGACFVLLVIAFALKLSNTSNYKELFRDVTATMEVPVHLGLFSQIGLIIWSVAAGALLIGLLVSYSAKTAPVGFILYSLALTLVLAADDAFLLHESVFGELLGVGEKVAYGLYGLAILGYFMVYYRLLLKAHFPLLMISLGLFALSIVVDLLPPLANYTGRDTIFLLEDGAKLAGIVFWCLFQMVTVSALITEQFSSQGVAREI